MSFVLLVAVGLSAMMAVAAQLALWTGKSGWIDAIWSFSVGAASVAAALVPLESSGATTERQWLVAALVATWATGSALTSWRALSPAATIRVTPN